MRVISSFNSYVDLRVYRSINNFAAYLYSFVFLLLWIMDQGFERNAFILIVLSYPLCKNTVQLRIFCEIH